MNLIKFLFPFIFLMIYSFFSDSSPACLPDLLTVYTPSRQLCSSAEIQILHIPHVGTKIFWPMLISCVPKERNSLPSDIRYIQSSQALKIALKNCLYKHTRSDFKFCLLPLPPPPPPLTFLLCTSMWCVFVCMYVCAREGVVCTEYFVYKLFLRFYVYIFVDLVKSNVLTCASEILQYINYC